MLLTILAREKNRRRVGNQYRYIQQRSVTCRLQLISKPPQSSQVSTLQRVNGYIHTYIHKTSLKMMTKCTTVYNKIHVTTQCYHSYNKDDKNNVM